MFLVVFPIRINNNGYIGNVIGIVCININTNV